MVYYEAMYTRSAVEMGTEHLGRSFKILQFFANSRHIYGVSARAYVCVRLRVCSSLITFGRLTDFHENPHICHTAGGDVTFIISNFLSYIPTWWPPECLG